MAQVIIEENAEFDAAPHPSTAPGYLAIAAMYADKAEVWKKIDPQQAAEYSTQAVAMYRFGRQAMGLES